MVRPTRVVRRWLATKVASSVALDMRSYEREVRNKMKDLAAHTWQRNQEAKRNPPNWSKLLSDVRELLGPAEASRMKPNDLSWIWPLQEKLRQAYDVGHPLWDKSFGLYRVLIKLEDSMTPDEDPHEEMKRTEADIAHILKETKSVGQSVVQDIQSAVRRIPTWGGQTVVVEPRVGDEWLSSASTFTITLGQDANFTVFTTNGKIDMIEDQLEAGDLDFFRSPEDSADYFNLIKELQSPGSSMKGKTRILYTARPIKDRAFYGRSRLIPVGVFLTSNPDDAAGLARDLGGSEERDVWQVRMNDAYLVQTLDAGSIKHFQVVGKKPAPVLGMDLIYEGSSTRRHGSIRVGDLRLSTRDKKVISALIHKRSASSRLLESDGRSLYKMGLGGEKVAVWRGSKIAVVSSESAKSDSTIIRYLVKVAGKNLVTFGYERKGHERSLRFESGGDGGHSGQYDGWVVAYAPERETPVGKLLYSYWSGHADRFGDYLIKLIEIAPEYRRSGVATALYKRLFRENNISKKDLRPAYLTEEGQAFRTRAILSSKQEFIPATDRNGKPIVPGDIVSMPIYPKGTARGTVVISRRAKGPWTDDQGVKRILPYLAVQLDTGEVYDLSSKARKLG